MNTPALPLFRSLSLHGEHGALVPLDPAHRDALADAVLEGELWTLWYTGVPSPAAMLGEIEHRLALQARGDMVPFTILDEAGVPVGMTTYCNIDQDGPRVEIGHTWYARRVQRSPLNTECKLLLLTHAFERLDCLAVEFRTSFFNRQSRQAIERLGAKLDGVLRSHRRLDDGALRDTCVYSIIAAEWPGVRRHLRYMLDSR